MADRYDPAQRLVFSTFPSDSFGALFERILTEAYGRLGYVIEVRRYPAERALIMADQGIVDGEAGRVNVVEESFVNLVRVPTPIHINRLAVLTKMHDLDPSKGWAQFKDYRICIRNGYKFVEKMTRGMNRHEVSSYDKMLKLLKNDRVDIGLAAFFDIMPTLGATTMEGVAVLKQPLASNPMYHYLHKKHAALVPRIDAVLHKMAEEGWMADAEHEMIHEYYRENPSPHPVLESHP